ncbi:hypothetical protein [Amycolatopsis sp. NPDC059021]
MRGLLGSVLHTCSWCFEHSGVVELDFAGTSITIGLDALTTSRAQRL